MYRKKKQRIKTEEKESNYFQLLEVGEEDSAAVIREAYLKKVKENPPEEKPQEFKQIRKAYEVLCDPEERQEYILKLRHGERIEELIERSEEQLKKENPKKAFKILQEAQDLAPEKLDLYFYGTLVGQTLGDEEIIEEQLQKLDENLPESPQERVKGLLLKSIIYFNFDRYSEAIETLNLTQDLEGVQEHSQEIIELYGESYMGLDDMENAARVFDTALSANEELKSSALSLINKWVHALFNLKRYSEKPRIKKTIKKIIEASDEEEKKFIQYSLWEEYMSYREAGRFQEAEFFVDLLYIIDKGKKIRGIRKELRDLAMLEKDYDRMWKDERLFPLVMLKAHEMYVKDFIPYEDPSKIWEMEEIQRFMDKDEEFASGIIRLKKKYKSMYHYYKKVWDALFKKKTAALNREARRRLR